MERVGALGDSAFPSLADLSNLAAFDWIGDLAVEEHLNAKYNLDAKKYLIKWEDFFWCLTPSHLVKLSQNKLGGLSTTESKEKKASWNNKAQAAWDDESKAAGI